MDLLSKLLLYEDVELVSFKLEPGVRLTCPSCWVQWTSYDKTCWCCEQFIGTDQPIQWVEKLLEKKWRPDQEVV
jgi:hypothetical protein